MVLHVRNQEEFAHKMRQLQVAGAKSLHVIADFDGTLAHGSVNGRHHGTLALIREGGYLCLEYVKASFALADKYRPLEKSHTLGKAEKAELMQEWWQQHLDLQMQYGMKKSITEKMIADRCVQARPMLEQFIETTQQKDIPLLIFSAGLGDVIEGFLATEKLLRSNVHIVSNFYAYDANDNVAGYRSKIIHTCNKSEVSIKETPYAPLIHERRNVLLLGDHVEDARMAEGMSHDITLSIGFLNGHIDLLDAYAEKFDAVLVQDAGLDDVVALVKSIC